MVVTRTGIRHAPAVQGQRGVWWLNEAFKPSLKPSGRVIRSALQDSAEACRVIDKVNVGVASGIAGKSGWPAEKLDIADVGWLLHRNDLARSTEVCSSRSDSAPRVPPAPQSGKVSGFPR